MPAPFSDIENAEIHGRVDRYYTEKVRAHGETAKGVDWSSEVSQRTRFKQLLKVVDRAQGTLLDVGCGYGALAAELKASGSELRYIGQDISAEMLARARVAHPEAQWVDTLGAAGEVDFAVASGIFNVRMDFDKDLWLAYVVKTIREIAAVARRGFSFNMLTSYSDPERMRMDLFYGEPGWFFDLCKRNHSRHVALLHDYGLYEFTIIVRKESVE